MSFPSINGFGITKNPLLVSPYVQNNDPGSNEFSDSDFLLLNGTPFMLLNGENLLLLGSS